MAWHLLPHKTQQYSLIIHSSLILRTEVLPTDNAVSFIKFRNPYSAYLQASALGLRSARKVEAVQVHDLVPDSNEVLDELVVGVRAGVDLSSRAELSVRADDKIGASGGPLLVGLAVDALEVLAALVGRAPRDIGVEDVDEELVCELARGLGEHTLGGTVPGGAKGTETTKKNSGLGDVKSKELGPVEEEQLSADTLSTVAVVAEAVGVRLKVLERLDVGLLLGGVSAAGCERHRRAGSLLKSGDTSEDDQVGNGHLLATSAVEVLLDLLKCGEDLAKLARVVDLPVLLRLKTDASTVGATTLVTTTESGSASEGDPDELGIVNTQVEDGLLELRDVVVADNLALRLRDGILPEEDLLGDFRTQPAATGTHVTVQELEPSAGEGIVELVRVLEEATRDLVVGRVEAKRQIGGQHSGLVLLSRVVGVGDDQVISLSLPLVCTSRALNLLPLVLVHILKVLVA